jgi:hypothetical protein
MVDSLSRWLQLREPADIAARSATLTRAVADRLPASGPVSLLDLGTGRGSNIRYLMPYMRHPQRWLAVDRSETLLSDLAAEMRSWGSARGYAVEVAGAVFRIRAADLECDIETRQIDLDSLEAADIFSGRHLVTASALLDLVSSAWLDSLARHCRAAGASALFTITYNGHSSCDPVEPEDDLVRELLNQHQHRNKGLGGAAAGPDAEHCAQRSFASAGYEVRREPSDWVLGPASAAMQRMLIDGWATAAAEQQPDLSPTIADWHRRRLSHLDAGCSRIIVSHGDLAAWLPRR